MSNRSVEEVAYVETMMREARLAERERCAKIALSHVCTFGSMAEELHSTATAKAIAAEIRRNEK